MIEEDARYFDHKRNNKIALRNFSSASDFHDVVKTLLVRMLRREHKRVPIYTEFNPNNPQKDYPDIWIKIGKDILVYEIQKEITKSWTKQIIEKHPDADVIIVPLKKLSRNLDELKVQLKDYVF